MNDSPLVWIIIGVSGSGKTVVGRRLAQELECDFLEGDRRHSLSNVLKMHSQQPLDDADRRPWLLEIEDDLRRAIDRHREIVMTCSALKAAFRKQLTDLGRVQLVWIDVPRSILELRLGNRPGHYMKLEMLDSQLASFEAISSEENVITIDGEKSIDDLMKDLMAKAKQRFPSLEKPWWERA
jgi:gluconokinase